jgi:hypothetical protein
MNNHITFEVEVYPVKELGMRIVGFQVIPMSMANSEFNGTLIPNCGDYKNNGDEEFYPLPQPIKVGPLVFSYDVRFNINKNKTYGSRWDYFMNNKTEDIQLFSLSVTFVTTLFLTAAAAILLRLALSRDLLKYQSVSELPQGAESLDMGWK